MAGDDGERDCGQEKGLERSHGQGRRGRYLDRVW